MFNLARTPNQRGFSLTEVMVGGAILAGVSLAGMKLFEQQKHAQKMVSYEASLNAYHQNLIKTFTNTQMCNATVSKVLSAGKIPSGSVNNFYNCRNENDCDDFKLDSSDPIDPVFPTNPASRWIENNTWRISSLGVLSAVTSSGDMRLQVTYESNPTFLQVLKSIKKEITVAVRFETGSASGSVFRECVNNQKASINNLQSDMCRAFNKNRLKTGVAGNYIASWDDAEQTCKFVKQADISCPLGQVFQGYDANGALKCKAEPPTYLPPTNPSLDSNPFTGTCVSTSVIVDKFGKLSIRCGLGTTQR